MKHYNKSIKGLSILGNIGAITIALLGLLSYVPGFGLLGSIQKNYIPMAPSTATCFIILGCFLYIMNTSTLSRLKLSITLSAVILVSIFGLLEVLGFCLVMDLNFEHAIVPVAGHLNDIPIGRMSPATGGVFFFAGIAVILLILRYRIPKYRIFLKHAGGIFGVLIILTSFTFCLSYIYGTPLLYGIGSVIPMALTTALAFLFLGLGIIGFSGRSAFPVRYLSGSGMSNYLLRYILPLCTLSVVLGGIIVSYAHHVSKINPAFASAFLTVIMIFIAGIFAILISRHTGNAIENAEKVIAKTTSSLSDSEERFRTIFEQSGGCFLILEQKSNNSLIIVDANESACKFHGYTKYELIGKLFSELSDDPEKTMPVGQIERVLSGEPYVEETTHIRKDGTTFPIMSYYCHIQIGESLPLILSAEYDITDSKLAEEKIKKLEMFPNENPAPVMRVDKNGLLLYANDSSMSLLTHWKTSISSKLPELWCERIDKALKKDQAMEHEIQYNGVSFSLNLCPIRDMNYVNIYAYDITDRKRNEIELIKAQEKITESEKLAIANKKLVFQNEEKEKRAAELVIANKELGFQNEEKEKRAAELQQVNEELKSFSYSVSHDLRAPLRALDGFSQVLLHDYKSKLDEDGQDSLQRIRKASVKMGELIDSLLKLSRISQVQMKAEKTDLSKIAGNITRKFIQDSPERDATFVIQPDIIVDGDASLLEIALDNLLGNAWKFTRKKKKTQIEFSFKKDARSQETVYSIKDNGAGFNMAYAGKLFGAFQRLHTQNEFEGIGIGLATVNRIIQRHHGKIWAESVEDEGTVFYFTLNI